MNISTDTTKGVDRQSKLKTSHLHRSIRSVVLCIGVILALTMNGRPALAFDGTEPIYVTGVIKSVKADTGHVTVDVTTTVCRGMRIFKTDKPELLAAYKDQRVSFFIGSGRCDVKETYTILTEWGVRK